MAANSKIEWTDHSWNGWIGCTKVSPACDHCYAERSTPLRTLKVMWGPGQPRHRTGADNWELPKRWNEQAAAFMAQHGRRQRVFCASLADVFDNEVPDEWRADLFRLIEATQNLDWLVLTKRIGNAERMMFTARGGHLPLLRNLWLGATICNQAEADRDIPKLLATPARVRFLSMEPLLGPVDLTHIPISGSGHHEFDPIIEANVLQRGTAADPSVHWVIVGGESGPKARPMHPDWALSLRDQCAVAGVPFLFKQWGEWVPAEFPSDEECYADEGSERAFEGRITRTRLDGYVDMARVGKKVAGRLLDGREWNEVPG